AFPQAKWHQYEPVNRDNARAGAVLAFGQDVNTIYDFSKAERILSLDCDFLSALPGMLRYARDFAARRRITEGKKEMSRLYVIETTPTNTGANADHHWTVKATDVLGLFGAIMAGHLPMKKGAPPPPANISSQSILAASDDLMNHKGSSILIV